MQLRKFKPLILLTLFHLSFSSAFCQESKDTIYFDENWSVCEKPVAKYYRICELNTDSIFFYKGEVKDYYINGKLEMTGDYSEGNNKNGEFIFYNKKGFVSRKGNYMNNVMFGDWYFYDSLGHLRAQFFCKTDLDFTPVFFINNKNDTLVKNGNGDFSFNNVTECPYILSKFGCLITGTVRNGVKDGEFKYYNYPKKELVYSEKYEDGRFLKSRWADSYYTDWEKDHSFMALLSDANLAKTEIFYHSNIAFGIGEQGLQKLINFLRYNTPPYIPAPINGSDQDKICFSIIFKILDDDFIHDSLNVITSDKEDGNNSETLSSSGITANSVKQLPKLKGDIKLTVDTTGRISDCVFQTNLTPDELHKLDYYLRLLAGLPVLNKDGHKIPRILNLKLNTVIDTDKNNLYVINYVLSNPNAFVPADETEDTSDSVERAVQIEAKPPGDWGAYLGRNLDPTVPAIHNAPNGIYTATVSFLVDENGNISDVRAENDPGYGTVEEAIRVVKKGPKWIPAIKDGKNVACRQKVNISFEVSGQ